MKAVSRLVAAVALTAALGGPAAAAETLLPFDQSEVRRILQHGPWPPPAARDPSNRVSGKPDAVALGRRLFFDARLSAGGAIACATCHVPARGWTDGRSRRSGWPPWIATRRPS